MYAVATIEKFIAERQELIGGKAPDILKRMKDLAINDAVHHRLTETVLGDMLLTVEFMSLVATDHDYSSLNYRQLRSSGNLSLT